MASQSKSSTTAATNAGNIVAIVLLGSLMLLMSLGFIESIRSLPEVEIDIHESNRVKNFGLDSNNRLLKSPRKASDEDGSLAMLWPVREAGEIKRKNKKVVVDGIELPEPKWPVSIRDEDGDFEDIVHPGDKKTIISVPKFWSGPLMNGELMTVKVAASIGTYSNGKTDKDLENKGPADERTIFVAIASYKDWQCPYTVMSIFNKAKFPNRVRVGVVDQMSDGDVSCGTPFKPCYEDPSQAACKYKDQIDIIELDALLAIGPVFARHLGHRLYRGEYYTMQVDAHVVFARNWDVDIISQHESTGNELAVLSTYLSDTQGALDAEGNSLVKTRPIMCNTDYEDGQAKHLRHLSQPENYPSIKGMPQLEPYWAAGFSFARGHFVVNIPYDLYAPMIFQGEEMSIGIRAFTYGYDHYAPERSVVFHAYAIGDHAESRNKVEKFWDHGQLYSGTGVGAMKRLLGVIGMNPEVDPSEWEHDEQARYGVGTVRKASKFFETFGINVVDKVVEQNLCAFVETGIMHNKFQPLLRPDGMGIDYSKIDYEFKSSDFE